MTDTLKNKNILKEYGRHLKEVKNFSGNTIDAYMKDIISLAQFLQNSKTKDDLTLVDYHMLRGYLILLKQKIQR